jgi:uncharacterized membrane protein
VQPAAAPFAGARAGVAGGFGVMVAVAVGLVAGWTVAPIAFWLAASALYLATTWIAIGRMDARSTARFATREDPTLALTHVIVLLASLASLGGVALLLGTVHAGSSDLADLLGVASVAAAWFTVHTIYTLGYAAAYYRGPVGGIDFNQQQPPAYADFAYVAFSLGMTYQVSDTSIGDPAIRRMALRHGLLSYLLGAVVLAITINLVAGLGH